MSKVYVSLLAIFALLGQSHGKIYTRCELARTLMKYPIFQKQINNWVCLVEKESSRNSAAVGPPNTDGSKDYGLFQLNSRYWCGANGIGGSCKITCQSLLTGDGVAVAVKCVEKVFKAMGLPAWYGWQRGCAGKKLPDVKDKCKL